MEVSWSWSSVRSGLGATGAWGAAGEVGGGAGARAGSCDGWEAEDGTTG